MKAYRYKLLPRAHLPQAPCKGQPNTHDCVSHSVSLRLAGVIWSPLVRISFNVRKSDGQFDISTQTRCLNTDPPNYSTCGCKSLNFAAIKHRMMYFPIRPLNLVLNLVEQCLSLVQRQFLVQRVKFASLKVHTPYTLLEGSFSVRTHGTCIFDASFCTFQCRRRGALHPSGYHIASIARRS